MRVVSSDYRRFAHARDRFQHPFDVFREYFEPFWRNDYFLFAALDQEAAGVVNGPDVTGVEPPPTERRASPWRCAIVARRNAVASNQNFAIRGDLDFGALGRPTVPFPTANGLLKETIGAVSVSPYP